MRQTEPGMSPSQLGKALGEEVPCGRKEITRTVHDTWLEEEGALPMMEWCQGIALVVANRLFKQHKGRLHMDITRWSIVKSD